jgi:hypothetical protein
MLGTIEQTWAMPAQGFTPLATPEPRQHPETDLSQMARLRGAATTPMAEAIDPQVRFQGFSPKKLPQSAEED